MFSRAFSSFILFSQHQSSWKVSHVCGHYSTITDVSRYRKLHDFRLPWTKVKNFSCVTFALVFRRKYIIHKTPHDLGEQATFLTQHQPSIVGWLILFHGFMQQLSKHFILEGYSKHVRIHWNVSLDLFCLQKCDIFLEINILGNQFREWWRSLCIIHAFRWFSMEVIVFSWQIVETESKNLRWSSLNTQGN